MQRSSVNNDKFISKTLSWLLRHGAVNEGLHISDEGYIPVEEVLQYKSLRGKYTLKDLERVVNNNDKKRFTLRLNDKGEAEVKANQGHSIKCVGNLELESIASADQLSNVIHGTYFKNWTNIKRDGLKCMNRTHIHFATGLPNDDEVISGMRGNVDLYIYINLSKALSSNIKFYKSVNGVILSPGNDNGIIESKFFLKVVAAKSGRLLDF